MSHRPKHPAPISNVPMTSPLRVLHLDSDRQESTRLKAMLTEAGIPCEIRRVQTSRAYTSALNEGHLDLIVAEWSLPRLDGGVALEMAQKLAPEVPFIFVSAALRGSLSIQQLHRGATDCILKEERARLVPSVRRALRERRECAARRRAQEALLQHEQQLRQMQKLETVGRLAGGLAHDFNNLLMVIMGHSQVLLQDMSPDHPHRSKVEEMQKAGDRAQALIRQLLTFSRKQASDEKSINLNTVVINLETMLRRLIGEDIKLTVKLRVKDLGIHVATTFVEQVVMNLAVNARDAMPAGGKLTIETTMVSLDRTPMYHAAPLPRGEYVKLSVTDTGYGMSPEVQAQMFKPFFTTKDETKGTGLGLSTVFDIVTQSGGALDVTSKLGKGTRIDVYFPHVESEIVTPTDRTAPLQSMRGHETILLVEDDEEVRTLIRDELRKLGYRIVEARNGVEACLVATPYLGKLQLLLTDIVMPGMSGAELGRNLRLIKPDLKMLFISGYTDDAGIGTADAGSVYLQKPFTPETLAGVVRQLLDRKPTLQTSNMEQLPEADQQPTIPKSS